MHWTCCCTKKPPIILICILIKVICSKGFHCVTLIPPSSNRTKAVLWKESKLGQTIKKKKKQSSSLFLSNLIAAAVPSFCILKIALFSALLAKGQSTIRTCCTENLYSVTDTEIYLRSVGVICSKHLYEGKWNFNVLGLLTTFNRYLRTSNRISFYLYWYYHITEYQVQYNMSKSRSFQLTKIDLILKLLLSSSGIHFKWLLVILDIWLAYKNATA